uniref:alkaline phosphatase n=1 Tax=Heterorhabditis bacteriophora TaxID=37862 RepID=A0A1I7XAG8_HETBA
MLPKTGEQCPRSGATDINDGVAEQALKKGLSVGFVTTTRITHATPGAMYAKGIVRWFEHDGNIPNGTDCAKDIASQLVQYPASEFKVMMGGGRNYLLDRSLGGNRTDGRNIEKEWAAIAGKRTVLTDVAQLDRFEAENNEKVLGGMIDQAEHENQMHLAFEELLEFDEAIKKARQLTDDSETLIIVTADHSHAMSLPGYLQVNQKSSFSWGQQDNLPIPGIYFTSGPGYGGEKRRNYTKEEATHPHFAQPAGIPMVKGVHGGDDVGIWSEGPFAWLFTGTIENTEVAYYIKFLLCLDRNEKNMCDLQNERENLYEKSSKRTSDQEGVINDIIDHIGSRNLLIISLILSFVVCILTITTLFLALILCMLNKRNLYSPDSETTLVK